MRKTQKERKREKKKERASMRPAHMVANGDSWASSELPSAPSPARGVVGPVSLLLVLE
jgi:hypothetical protein